MATAGGCHRSSELSRTQITCQVRQRDLRSGKYCSETPLAISADFDGDLGAALLARKRKTFPR
ncbi:hypothetical protein J6590_013391 [Homalodisca vitripennis]|nr:hypothetical protein J6590_013391 [Homalodisca vitripennis]